LEFSPVLNLFIFCLERKFSSTNVGGVGRGRVIKGGTTTSLHFEYVEALLLLLFGPGRLILPTSPARCHV